jgi:hypothetical protein
VAATGKFDMLGPFRYSNRTLKGKVSFEDDYLVVNARMTFISGDGCTAEWDIEGKTLNW